MRTAICLHARRQEAPSKTRSVRTATASADRPRALLTLGELDHALREHQLFDVDPHYPNQDEETVKLDLDRICSKIGWSVH